METKKLMPPTDHLCRNATLHESSGEALACGLTLKQQRRQQLAKKEVFPPLAASSGVPNVQTSFYLHTRFSGTVTFPNHIMYAAPA
jgi:hypothetical protein